MKMDSVLTPVMFAMILLEPAVVPLCASAAGGTPDKLIVGKWRDVHGDSETVEFDGKGGMESTSGLGKFPGVYTLVGGNTLDYSLTLPSGIRKNKMIVAFVGAEDLILQSQTTKAHTIYKKVVCGKLPALMAVKKFPQLISGRWKQGGPNPETLDFDGRGKMAILAPRQYFGSYSIRGDVIEMSIATPGGVKKSKATIGSISPTLLTLIYPNNQMSVYQRQ
jgi:hypothetical protein